eukprot:PITA_30220
MLRKEIRRISSNCKIKMPRYTNFLFLLPCVIISGFTTYQVYKGEFSGTPWENGSLKASQYLLHGNRHNPALVRHEGGIVARAGLRNVNNISKNLYIQDVVMLPEDEVVLLIQMTLPLSSVNFGNIFPPKSTLRCVFADQFGAPVKGIDYLRGRVVIRCPLGDPNWVDFRLKAGRHTTIALTGSDDNILPISARTVSRRPVKWNSLVYENIVQSDEYGDDLILFAKGINRRRGNNAKPRNLRCVFNSTVETAVTVSAQEIFRCKQPEKRLRPALLGAKVTLRSIRKNNRFPFPSVAYYHPDHIFPILRKESRKLKLCACTMVFNGAKFLKEWIVYHSHLGVEKFIIYDNNSDDNLEEIIKFMADSGYNMWRHPWPWAKTQEAGFAHCALQARDSCHWVMFTDIDEFIFSPLWLKQLRPNSTFNALGLLLMNKTKTTQMINSNSSASGGPRVGQVSINCRNFGPSYLKSHPPQGVTQGYTCRENLEQRHKSIVLLDALSPSLLNVIHHFELKPGYKTIRLASSEAVINHYKYQAWIEFKAKFRRRVSAYVADWKESKNPLSQDRAPGLGSEAIEPAGWESKFCQVNDTALREFTSKVFRVTTGSIPVMQWQL